MINLMCVMLTLYQLRRLYADFTTSNLEAVSLPMLLSPALSPPPPDTLHHRSGSPVCSPP
jgi:hypothetical protein